MASGQARCIWHTHTCCVDYLLKLSHPLSIEGCLERVLALVADVASSTGSGPSFWASGLSGVLYCSRPVISYALASDSALQNHLSTLAWYQV